MEITAKTLPEERQTPQYRTDTHRVWDFGPANPENPILVSQGDSQRPTGAANALEWLMIQIALHWHELALLCAIMFWVYCLASPIALGNNIPLAAIPPYAMSAVVLGIAWLTRNESKTLTAWLSAVSATAVGYASAGVML